MCSPDTRDSSKSSQTMDTHHAGGACRAAAGLRCSHLISNGWSYQGPRRVGIQKYVVAGTHVHPGSLPAAVKSMLVSCGLGSLQ